jgi:hypothetical protein
MAINYTKWPLNIPTFSIPRPSKIYPSWNFWSYNKPSGNLALNAMLMAFGHTTECWDHFSSLIEYQRPLFKTSSQRAI